LDIYNVGGALRAATAKGRSPLGVKALTHRVKQQFGLEQFPGGNEALFGL